MFVMAPARLPCPHDWGTTSCGGVGDDELGLYAFDLSSAALDRPARIYMGDTVALGLRNEGERWRVRNLRSFQTNGCDDYWNYAFFIASEAAQFGD